MVERSYALRVSHLGMRDADIVGVYDDGTKLMLCGHVLSMRIKTYGRMRPFKLTAALRCHECDDGDSENDETVEIDTYISGPCPETTSNGNQLWTCCLLTPFRIDAARRALTQAIDHRMKSPKQCPWPFGDSYLQNATLYVTLSMVASPWVMHNNRVDQPPSIDTYARVKVHRFAQSNFRRVQLYAKYATVAESAEVSDRRFRGIADCIFSIRAIRTTPATPTDCSASMVKTNDGWTFFVPHHVASLPSPKLQVAADAVHVAAILMHLITGNAIWDPNSSVELAYVARIMGLKDICQAMINAITPKDEMLRHVLCPLLNRRMSPLHPATAGGIGHDAFLKRAARCVMDNARPAGMVNVSV